MSLGMLDRCLPSIIDSYYNYNYNYNYNNNNNINENENILIVLTIFRLINNYKLLIYIIIQTSGMRITL